LLLLLVVVVVVVVVIVVVCAQSGAALAPTHAGSSAHSPAHPPTLTPLYTRQVYGYRTKLTPHHDKPDPVTGAVGNIGFQRLGSRGMNLVDVEYCAIATPEVCVGV
jgi:hypothetical protein